MGVWPQEVTDYLSRLKSMKDMTYQEIASELTRKFPNEKFSAEKVRSKWRRMLDRQHGIVVEQGGFEEVIPIASYPQVEDQRNEIYNKFREASKLLVLSDLHIPHQDTEFIRQQLSLAKQWQADVVVLAGDILDCGKFSSFSTGGVPYKAEHGIAKGLIREIADDLDVVMIRGNHDIRLMRYLSKRVNLEEFSFLFGEMDPLAKIADELGINYVPDWWCQIGPVIISHPTRYSNVDLKNIVNTVDYFVYRQRSRYWDTVVQGHSHKANMGLIRGIQYFETGCTCRAVDYNFGPNQTQPIWTQAAAFIEIEAGEVAFNKSRLITGRTLTWETNLL